jgi:hypothetical protein
VTVEVEHAAYTLVATASPPIRARAFFIISFLPVVTESVIETV